MPSKIAERDDRMLSQKEARFVAEYPLHDTPTAAARAAGYRNVGDLLRRPRVAKAIKKEMGKLLSKNKITAERVVEEIAEIAFGNIDDFVDDDWTMVKEKPSRRHMRMVKSVTSKSRVTQEGDEVLEVKLDMNDKLAALDKLMRHFGQYNDKIEISGDLAERLERATQRLKEDDEPTE